MHIFLSVVHHAAADVFEGRGVIAVAARIFSISL